ncbi:MAG: helix-turn-helix domain-containing protein [Saprospiraceae bacterium]
MNINFWIILFTIAAAQGYFVATVLFVKKENRVPNRLLGAFLLLLAITLSEWLLWWTGLIRQVPGLMAVSVAFPLLYGPFLLLFYQATFQKITSNWGLHFIPALLLVLLMTPFYLRFVYPQPTVIQSVTRILQHPLFPITVFSLMSFYGIWMARRFRPFLQGNSELQRWHRLILLAYLGIILAYIFYRLLPTLELQAPVWKYLIALSLTGFIYLIAWLGYVQPQVLAGVRLQEALQPKKYRKSSLSALESQQLFQQITRLIESESLYANGELDLETLSQKLKKSRHHISQAINEQTGGNFADFINRYRIQAAQDLLANRSKREKNVIEVAYEVGFNSKKAFNLAFKKITGMTPTEYRQVQEKRG